MKAWIQRVTEASVTIGGETVASIGRGYLVLLGVTHSDTEKDADELAALLERELLRRAGAVLRLERELGADLLALPVRAGLEKDADLPVRLSVSVRVSHAGDMRDG